MIRTQVNPACVVDRHSQRAAWCPGRLVSACSLRMNTPVSIFESNGLKTTLKIMVGHRCTYADMSTRQVHTLQLQLQQQRFNTYQLTPLTCPQKCKNMEAYEIFEDVQGFGLNTRNHRRCTGFVVRKLLYEFQGLPLLL